MALEVALSVPQELQGRWEDTDRQRRQQVERARYEAELGRRRYMQVDPDNRLVADELEAEWNRRLRALTEAQGEYERQRQADRAALDEQERRRILALATDSPRLWQAPGAPDRERKPMVRLVLEDVTLIKGTPITVHVTLPRRRDANADALAAAAGVGPAQDEPRGRRRGRPLVVSSRKKASAPAAGRTVRT